MDQKTVQTLLKETAYVRTGGSKEEHRCAKYIAAQAGGRLESFSVPCYTVLHARLTVDGREIPCKGYFNTCSGMVKGELVYLPRVDKITLKECKDKLVLLDGPIGAPSYRRLVEHGALGIVSANGDALQPHRDIDQKEVRGLKDDEPRIPGVLINTKDAVALAHGGQAVLELEHQSEMGESLNVLLDLPGERSEWIVFSAHYDSTALSCGAYDNMSGCIVQLAIAEQLKKKKLRCGVRFLWCGSEERGLLGSKAYCAAHAEELGSWRLNINLDMLGSPLGGLVGFSTADEKTRDYLADFAATQGVSMETRLGLRSSDSNSFADVGVPAVSFARYAPSNSSTVHNRYDSAETVDADRLMEDIAFIGAFAETLAMAEEYPLDRCIGPKVREELDRYFKKSASVGVDWMAGRWLAVELKGRYGSTKTFATIEALCEEYSSAEHILIDVPIGLPESAEEALLRPDQAARAYLASAARKSSIFPVPCRQAVYAAVPDAENRRVLGKGISAQGLGILPTVRQTDAFLTVHPEWQNRLVESHPECAFQSLAGRGLSYSKHKEEGIAERTEILKQYVSNVDFLLGSVKRRERADLLDALCLAVVNREGFCPLSAQPVFDSKGLPMRIVIKK